MSTDEDRVKDFFSKQLQSIMKEHQLQQNELAKILDVKESTVGKWILKKSIPRMGIIQKLSDYFNKPKSYFLDQHNNDHLIGGVTDTKKPLDLKKFLDQAEVMFDGELYHLDEIDRQKVRDALEYAFWHAKQKNKRKKPE